MAKKEKTIDEQVEELKVDAVKKLRKNATDMLKAQQKVVKKQGIENGEIPYQISEEIMGDALALEGIKEYYLGQKEVALDQLKLVEGFHPIIKGGYRSVAKNCQKVADIADKMIVVINDYEAAVKAIGGTLENEQEEPETPEGPEVPEDELGHEQEPGIDFENKDPKKEDEPQPDETNKGKKKGGTNKGPKKKEEDTPDKENELTPDDDKKDDDKKDDGKKDEPKKGGSRRKKKVDEPKKEDELPPVENNDDNKDDNKDDDNKGKKEDEQPEEELPPVVDDDKKDDDNNDDNNGGDDNNDDNNNDDNNDDDVKKKDEEELDEDAPEEELPEEELGEDNGDNDDNGNGDDNKQNPRKPGLLDNIPKKYYKPIFKLINNTVVLGNKDKFNTLENLEYQLSNADIAKLQELGLPVTNNPEKAELIRQVALKFVKASKEIRKDQWLSALDTRKRGNFEARKHTTEEAIIDRNEKLLRRFNISRKLAREYGLSLSQEDIQRKNSNNRKAKEDIKKVREDENFISFYNQIQEVYQLGSTNGNTVSLNSVYKDLTSGNNSYGLTGDALKAAIELVEREIIVRRNTYKSGKAASTNAINSERDSLIQNKEPEQPEQGAEIEK